MDRRVGLPLTIALKALVIGLTAIGAFGGLERFEEKGFGWRYTDTIGDMTFGLAGSLLAAAAIYVVARHRDAARDDAAPQPA